MVETGVFDPKVFPFCSRIPRIFFEGRYIHTPTWFVLLGGKDLGTYIYRERLRLHAIWDQDGGGLLGTAQRRALGWACITHTFVHCFIIEGGFHLSLTGIPREDQHCTLYFRVGEYLAILAWIDNII